MASIYELKPKFQALLRPLMKWLARIGARPNLVTIVAFAGSVAAGAAAFPAHREPLWLLVLPVWLFVRMALNAIDGMMARELGMATRVGAFINEVGDIASDLALYLPLAWVIAAARLPVAAFCLTAVLTEFVGLAGQAAWGVRRFDGPMGKSDRAFWVGALALSTAFLPLIGAYWPVFFWTASAVATLTCLIRAVRAARAAKESENVAH
jgi:CDP-diacylglycerol---glycerol-3-phosphate 3-phosphatidyltransferase